MCARYVRATRCEHIWQLILQTNAQRNRATEHRVSGNGGWRERARLRLHVMRDWLCVELLGLGLGAIAYDKVRESVEYFACARV